jgi:alpha-ketoglutarate-dependent sulfate ester dioxygenase
MPSIPAVLRVAQRGDPPVSCVWANTVATYETLPPLLRGLADQLWALHSNGYDYAHPNAMAWEAYYRETVFKATNYETEYPVGQVYPRDRGAGHQPRLFCSQASRRQFSVNSTDSARVLPRCRIT